MHITNFNKKFNKNKYSTYVGALAISDEILSS